MIVPKEVLLLGSCKLTTWGINHDRCYVVWLAKWISPAVKPDLCRLIQSLSQTTKSRKGGEDFGVLKMILNTADRRCFSPVLISCLTKWPFSLHADIMESHLCERFHPCFSGSVMKNQDKRVFLKKKKRKSELLLRLNSVVLLPYFLFI